VKAVVILMMLCATAFADEPAHEGLTAGLDCSACHTSDSWKLAGVAAKAGFDHDKTGFPLRGKHVQTGCQDCHHGTQPSETCDGCHRDPHQGRMDGQCYECHTAVAWSDVAQLEQHRRTRMPLTGKHAIIECNACHKRQSERTFSDLPVDCYGCHAKDYHSPHTHPNHDGTDPTGTMTPFPRTCGMCHNTTTFSQAFTDSTMVMPRVQQTLQHDTSFQLSTGSHKLVACADCHVDKRRPKMVRCDGCHSDVRKQHSRPVSMVASACLSCHPRGIRR
jgi:hypothetical protein